MNTQTQTKQQFIGKHAPGSNIVFLASDMSSRSYDRVFNKNKTFVLMNDQNEENITKFLRITDLLLEKNIYAPKVHAHDIENGFVLMDDLGDNTLTKLLKLSAEKGIYFYQEAISILHKIQTSFEKKPTILEAYSNNILLEEASLFITYYYRYIHSKEAEKILIEDWNTLWHNAFQKIEGKSPNTLVLRDYHVDNLIVKNNKLYVLDYQDALWGSIVYDFISLIEDARQNIDSTLKEQLTKQFLKNHEPNIHQDLLYVSDIIGAGRHAKILGVFTRYFIDDKNASKLIHLKRVFNLLLNALEQSEERELLYFLKDQGFLKKIAS